MPTEELFGDEFLQRLQRLGLIAKRIAATSPASGQRRSRRLGDGLEFADHRPYAPGDDLRFLDWPYYARMERMLLRLFHEHSEGAVCVLLDCSASMALGEAPKFGYARRTAAALAYVAMCGLDRVRLLPFGEELGDGMLTGRNRGQILQVLEFLEGLACRGRTNLDEVVAGYARRHADTGVVFLISDLLDCQEALSPALAALRTRKDHVVVLHIADPWDADPDLGGPVQLSAVESSQRMNLHVTGAILDSYLQQWRKFVSGSEKICLGRGASYVQAPTSAPFERLVMQTLVKAGVLQS